MKKYLLIIVLTISFNSVAQVGIGTLSPNGALDITSTNNGLLIPRIALSATNIPTVSTPTVSELVYNTATSGIGILQVTPGYYYWNGSIWVRLSSGTSTNNDWSVSGNSGTNPSTNFAGTIDNQDFAIRTNNIERARIKTNGTLGLGTTNPRGALDINSSTLGIVPPRVSLTSTIVEAPVTNPAGGGLVAGTLVWNTNTAGTIPTNVAPGMYYWNGTRWISLAGSPGGLDWAITGNGGINGGTTTTGGTHFLGTYDNTNIDIRTNGVHRARVSALGEFFIGAYDTVLPGDLMNGVSLGNTTFPWAINGYTDQNGAGVYGLVQAGNTFYAGVQGEYRGTNPIGAGVRGLIGNTTSGTNFASVIGGVKGDGAITATTAGTYKFGVAARGGYTTRSGAVFGDNFGIASGALGYYANNGNDYAVYGFGNNHTNGNAGGKTSNSSFNNMIGLGIYGGVVGGWIKGKEYGLINTGERFANYNLGKTISNESFIVLDKKKDGKKIASYATTSTSIDIQTKGKAKLVNGTAYILFDKNYSEIIDPNKPIIVTVSPLGETKGVYVSSTDKNGFTIKENSNGTSNVSFNWIAISEKLVNHEPVSKELLTSEFDRNINDVMHNDNDNKGKAIWSSNGVINFAETAPMNTSKIEQAKSLINVEKPKK